MNKFYLIQVLKQPNKKYIVWARWGRVGERGQSSLSQAGGLEDAMKQFDSKFKQKSGLTWAKRFDPPKGGKYTFLERNYEVDSDSDEPQDKKVRSRKEETGKEPAETTKAVESALPEPVQRLMEFIFNHQLFAATLENMNYDSRKLPLGKLSKRTLEAGFQLLKDLSELVATPSLAQTDYNTSFARASESLSNQYFTTIPHVFGRNRPPVIATQLLIKREVELLEALTDMEIGNEILNSKSKSSEEDAIHDLDRQFAMLDLQEMTPCELQSLFALLIQPH
jgi:poly [ADP-ribose] polymerase